MFFFSSNKRVQIELFILNICNKTAERVTYSWHGHMLDYDLQEP